MASKKPATKKASGFRVWCNACAFEQHTGTQESADVIAARHAGSVHADSTEHHLAKHIIVEEVK